MVDAGRGPGFRIEVNADGVVARLDGLASALTDASEPLAEAGALLLMRFWDRIAGRPASVYSERYRRWLLAAGEWSGKLVGVLSGALVGAMAPGVAGSGAALRTEPEAPGRSQLVGFLDPGQAAKARGFTDWYASRFGAGPFLLTQEDERDVGQIFGDWLARAGNGGAR
jgi:hypothetical protein